MMKIDVLASGSGGNCIAIRSNQTTILVDAGIAKTKIEKRLLDVGIRPDSIKAIFITHAHADHIKGLPLANKYKIPVFAGENEWKLIGSVDEENRWSFTSGNDFGVDNFHVQSFKTYHDAFDPVGYVFEEISTSEKCSICLDTGKVDEDMLEVMKGSNIYIIEANHEPKMVKVSDYPNSVKARIVSDNGHLSNEQTAAALHQLIQGTGEKIYLTHLSSKNNMPALAELTVVRTLLKKGLKKDRDYYIEVI